jgi:hypothetical protein
MNDPELTEHRYMKWPIGDSANSDFGEGLNDDRAGPAGGIRASDRRKDHTSSISQGARSLRALDEGDTGDHCAVVDSVCKIKDVIAGARVVEAHLNSNAVD